MAAAKTFIIERTGANGTAEKIELKAERGDQDPASTRVTFYDGETVIASFINVQGWYPKT